MSREYYDKCGDLIDTEADNPSGERTRIAEVGAAALSKLNAVMKQMKDWREDRESLRRNIRQLKTALVDHGGLASDAPLYSDSFLEHRRNEVKRLKSENESLRKELAETKAAMNDAKSELLAGNFPAGFFATSKMEETNSYQSDRDIGSEYLEHVVESLQSRLVEFTIGDQNIEILFVNVLGKAAEAIANLCEEVVNVTESLHTTKYSNADLHAEVDKLKAMLRSRTGDRVNYQKRFNELGGLSKELKNHINTLRANKESESSSASLERSNLLIRVEELVNNLKNRLVHDREALVAAGDPDCLMYLKKVTELRINLSCLHYGPSEPRASGDLEFERRASAQQRMPTIKLSTLASLLREIDAEIYKFRDQNLLKHYWMNNFDSRKYLSKVEQMENMVRGALAAISSLKSQSCLAARPGKPGADALDELVSKLCGEIKELEMIVLSQDSASLFRRIEQLEESVVRLKTELAEKDERTNSLEEKFSNTRLALEQKIKELKDTQRRIAMLAEENKTFAEKTKAMEQRILGLHAEFEADRKQMGEVQQVNSSLRGKLCNLEADKEAWQNEIRKVRATLREKENQIENIVNEHNAKEKATAMKLENLSSELQAALAKNEKLEGKIQEVTSTSEATNRGRTEELIQASKIKLHRLGIELDQSRRSLDSANCEIIDLQGRLDHSGSDRKRLEENFARLESDRETLLHQLEAEKATGTERLEESRKLISENNQLQSELARARAEADHSRQAVTELQAEKEQLQKLTKDLNNKCATLKSNADMYNLECEALQHKLSNTKSAWQDLTTVLETVRAELNAALARTNYLESENSRLRDNFDSLTLNSGDAEARLQVLLTENNDLATRIKELDEANVTLRDQLNKARAENEYFSIELHKSRAENDKARSEFVLLQDTSAQILKRSNIRLRRTGDKLRERINELENARAALEDELKAAHVKHEMLKKERESLYRENATLKDYSNKFNQLGRIARTKEGQLVIISNAILREDEKQDNKCTSAEIGINEKERRVVEYDEDDRGGCTKPEAKAKIIGRRRVMPKKLRVENDALKFEMTNLRAQNSELKLELSEAKAQLEKLHAELTSIKEFAESIRPISNKLEITSLYYKQGISRCPTENTLQIGDSVSNALAIPTVSDMRSLYGSQAQWYLAQEGGTLLRHMKQLEIQNMALIKENASLRSYVFVALADREKAENSLRDAMDEILALRMELRKLREERDSLRARLDTARTELDKLTSEKIAMKDEFITLRNEIVELRQRAGELRSDYQKLEQTNAGLEESLMSTAKVVNKYTMNVGNFDGLRDQLKAILEQYLSAHDFLATTKH